MDSLTAARRVLDRLRGSGHRAYLAGGSVRDHLLGWTAQDHDVATSASPDAVEALFPRSLALGKQFGVISVLIGGRSIEVATFRADGSYSDGRRPDGVRFAGPEEDVARRDFTVNGLLWDPDTDEILDFVGGRNDLAARRIRAIGDPQERIAEDALRLLRAVRFGSLGDFHLDPDTQAAVQRHAASLRRVSGERVRDELRKMATHPRSRRGDGWRLLCATGLASIVFPEVSELDPEEVAAALDRLPMRGLVLYLAVIGSFRMDRGAPPTSGRELARTLVDRYRGSRDELRALEALIGDHGRYRTGRTLRLARQRLAAAREDGELHEALLVARDLGSIAAQLEAARTGGAAVLPAPLVDGRVLLANGVRPGRTLGRKLRRIRVAQIEGRVRNESEALLLAAAR